MVDVEHGYSKVRRGASVDSIELRHLRTSSSASHARSPFDGTSVNSSHASARPTQLRRSIYGTLRQREQVFWDRFRGKGQRVPGWGRSLKNALVCSCEFYILRPIGPSLMGAIGLNVLFPIVPLAWVSHYLGTQDHWPVHITFGCAYIISISIEILSHLIDSRPLTVCFVAIIPLERLFDWGGEQMAFYLGKDLGDLLMITMNK